jgi:hypothetical protein
VSATGWTYEQVEALTLPRLNELTDYWEQVPPVNVSANQIRMIIRSYFKIKDDPKTGEAEEVKTLEDFIGDFMAAGGGINVKGNVNV